MSNDDYFKKQVKALAYFLRREFKDRVAAEEAKGQKGLTAVQLASKLLKEFKIKEKNNVNKFR